MDPEKLKLSTTTDGKPPRPGFEDEGAPAPIDPKTGMYAAYWVLSEEERAKGFVRPVRTTYQHVGPAGPRYPLRDLDPQTEQHHIDFGYIKFEAYPESDSALTGRFWTRDQLDQVGKGCGTTTRMGMALSETYARDPKYYGSTFCCGCSKHLPVGEFVWDGTDERVGSTDEEAREQCEWAEQKRNEKNLGAGI